jgi:arylsulfatase A-like enzyme
LTAFRPGEYAQGLTGSVEEVECPKIRMRFPAETFSRRSLSALALQLLGGGILETLKPETVMADDPATDQMNAGAFGWTLNADPAATETPSIITNPNILMIMVDQLRIPQYWLNSSQQGTLDTMAPNIAFLRKNSYYFTNFYIAAQNCTPSRATLLTGFYAPQTGMFATQTTNEPALNTGFRTFGNALQDIAGYSASNIQWFGKWHVSNHDYGSTDKLPGFGFNSGRSTQINWPSKLSSPNGSGNEGNNGYLNASHGSSSAVAFACDQAIYNDFSSNLSAHPPSSPWFTCVSFVNPHDISLYPGFFYPTESAVSGSQGIPQNPNLPAGTATDDFLPSSNTFPTTLIGATPSGFNYEMTTDLRAKSIDYTGTTTDPGNFLQPYFQRDITDAACNLISGSSPPAVLSELAYNTFLNWYFYMIQLVDIQIGNVLTAALPGYSSSGTSNPSSTTAIIFLSDHGEYGGSHGLHAKGGAVYDEVLRVPLYAVMPSQSGSVQLNQMCSMVDMFRFVVELALGSSTYSWSTNAVYEDQVLNLNQSLLSFIQNNSAPETRYYVGHDGNPYAFILSTTDETYVDYMQYSEMTNVNCSLRNHVMCMRTKSYDDLTNPSTAYSGGKLAYYSKWVLYPSSYTAPIVDATLGGTDLIIQDFEYYDYLNYNNRGETGNDYYDALNAIDGHGITGSGPGAQSLLRDMLRAFGNMQLESAPGTISPASGYIATMLTRTLTGSYGGTTFNTYTVDGISAWYSWVQENAYTSCSS